MILFSDDEDEVDLTSTEADLAKEVENIIIPDIKDEALPEVEVGPITVAEAVSIPANKAIAAPAVEVDPITVNEAVGANNKIQDKFTGYFDETDEMMKDLDELEKLLGFKVAIPKIPMRPIELPKPEIKPVDMGPRLTREDVEELNDEQLAAIMKKLNKIDGMHDDVEELKRIIDERLGVDFRAMYSNLMDQMNIEAIKIYRNVQAVIVEENAKQNKAMYEIDDKMTNLKKRINNLMLFAIVSFVVSILVMLMQILPALGIDLF